MPRHFQLRKNPQFEFSSSQFHSRREKPEHHIDYEIQNTPVSIRSKLLHSCFYKYIFHEYAYEVQPCASHFHELCREDEACLSCVHHNLIKIVPTSSISPSRRGSRSSRWRGACLFPMRAGLQSSCRRGW